MLMARKKSSRIQSFYDNEGQLKSALQDIHKVAQLFYKSIFSQEEGSPMLQDEVRQKRQWVFEQAKDIINPGLIPKLIQLITEAEVSAAVKDLQQQRMPGLDGFPMEFFSPFIDLVIPMITKMFQEGWAAGELPPDILQGDITLIPKAGDQELIENN